MKWHMFGVNITLYIYMYIYMLFCISWCQQSQRNHYWVARNPIWMDNIKVIHTIQLKVPYQSSWHILAMHQWVGAGVVWLNWLKLMSVIWCHVKCTNTREPKTKPYLMYLNRSFWNDIIHVLPQMYMFYIDSNYMDSMNIGQSTQHRG